MNICGGSSSRSKEGYLFDVIGGEEPPKKYQLLKSATLSGFLLGQRTCDSRPQGLQTLGYVLYLRYLLPTKTLPCRPISAHPSKCAVAALPRGNHRRLGYICIPAVDQTSALRRFTTRLFGNGTGSLVSLQYTLILDCTYSI